MRKMPKAVAHIYNTIVVVVGFGIFYFTDLGYLVYLAVVAVLHFCLLPLFGLYLLLQSHNVLDVYERQ